MWAKRIAKIASARIRNRWFDHVREQVEICARKPHEKLLEFFTVLGACFESSDLEARANILSGLSGHRYETFPSPHCVDDRRPEDDGELDARVQGYLRRVACAAGFVDASALADELLLVALGAIVMGIVKEPQEAMADARSAAERLIASARTEPIPVRRSAEEQLSFPTLDNST
jgi:hypothetical protein